MTNVITDRETGVQYLLTIFPNVGSGLAVLLDKDGKHLLKKMKLSIGGLLWK